MAISTIKEDIDGEDDEAACPLDMKLEESGDTVESNEFFTANGGTLNESNYGHRETAINADGSFVQSDGLTSYDECEI